MINRRRDIYDNDKDYNNNKVGDDHTDDNEEDSELRDEDKNTNAIYMLWFNFVIGFYFFQTSSQI